jgi:putative transcriptional regulator
VGPGRVLGVTTVWGFLSNAGVVPAPPLFLVLPLFCAVLGDQPALHPEAVPMKNRLKVLRAERDWSQADLAERLEVSRQTVNALETGKYDPSLPLAFKIARLFEQPIEAIFQDEA